MVEYGSVKIRILAYFMQFLKLPSHFTNITWYSCFLVFLVQLWILKGYAFIVFRRNKGCNYNNYGARNLAKLCSFKNLRCLVWYFTCGRFSHLSCVSIIQINPNLRWISQYIAIRTYRFGWLYAILLV